MPEIKEGYPPTDVAAQGGTGLPPISEARRRLVTDAIEHWKKHLYDISRNNRLLYYKDLKTKTLRLTDLSEEADTRLLTAKPVSLDELLPTTLADSAGEDREKLKALKEAKLADYRKRANYIFGDAQAFFEEQGLETLFLAVGLATWDDGSPKDQRRPAAGILLVPFSLTAKGAGATKTFTLEATGEVILNPVLLHALSERGLKLNPDEILDGIEGFLDGDPGINDRSEIQTLYTRLREKAHGVRAFDISDDRVVSNFAYYKQAMVRDLEECVEELVRHPIIAAIAGDNEAQADISREYVDPEPREFDDRKAKRRDLILDADSSQELVIRRILDGQSAVIQGPPGTGKSQTIANAIGALTHAGMSMLFVAEKRAAIEAVAKRLVATGLGHFILDLHGRGITRKALAAQLAKALAGVKGTSPEENGSLYKKHDRHRKKVIEHHDRMHALRDPTGLSVYQMRCRIAECPEVSRWAPHLDLRTLTAFTDVLEAFTERTNELAEFSDLLSGETPTPWIRAPFDDPAFSFSDAHTLSERTDKALATLESALSPIGFTLKDETTLDSVRETQRILARHTGLSAEWKQSVWGIDLTETRETLEQVGSGIFAHLKAFCFNSAYRETRKRLAMHSVSGIPKFDTPLADVRKLNSARKAWKENTGSGQPALAQKVKDAESATSAALQAIDELHELIPDLWSPNPTWTEVIDEVDNLASDRVSGQRLAVYAKGRQELNRLFPGDMKDLDGLLALPPDHWQLAIEYAVAKNAHREAAADDPAVEGFSGNTHQEIVHNFQAADRDLLPATAKRVAREHGQHFIEVCNEYPEEYQIIRREAEKKSRHKSLRKLMEEAPHVLTALFPCWMASPLSVSQLLSPSMRFDVVLFDEASQIFPWDAVPSVFRGEQIVVAGDRHQMPPTAYFNLADEEDVTAEAEAYEGYESLLAQTSSFLPDSYLQWHYRSEDERLIAFSNHHVYHGSLITFPGTGKGRHPIGGEVVEVSGNHAENTRSGPDEVNRVVELIIEHAENHGDESLGVIAMGITHVRRIEMALDQALDLRPDLEEFFDPNKEDRFFVKNLERVQGDERDSIILSVGYAPDRGGNLRHNFGPITHDHGYRRLNVAVSRARKHMKVVSSFSWRDVDLSKTSARGVKFLKDFLRYADTGGKLLTDEEITSEPMNPWELEIYDKLTGAGLDLIPQYGASGFRIDMVAKHPDNPGEYVLAIECDGASYHSSPIARERDRLRQQILERLGWRFHRIWSTDWWNDSKGEIAKTLAAFQAALRGEPISVVGQLELATGERGGAEGEDVGAPERTERKPYLRAGEDIDAYAFTDLEQLARWVESDGKLRTNDEIIEEIFEELHFSRRGAKIMRTLRRAVASVKK